MGLNCENIIEKWKKDPNFCKKNKSAVNDINNHIKILDTLRDDYGVEQKSAIADFREGASRPIRREKDDNVKSRALAKVAERVNDGQKVTGKIAREIIKEIKLEIKKEENPDYEEIADNCAIEWFTGNYLDKLSHLKDVDLILTDPPYNAAFDSKEWGLLGQFAVDVLVDGGYFISYCGHLQLLDALTELSEYLDHYWIAACLHGNQARLWGKKTWVGWKPIVIFTNGEPSDHHWFNDTISDNDKDTKEFHDWSQPISQAKKLIEIFCPEGGTVLDPMCGAGTAPIAAYQLKRRAYGCDQDAKAIELCKVRFAELDSHLDSNSNSETEVDECA